MNIYQWNFLKLSETVYTRRIILESNNPLNIQGWEGREKLTKEAGTRIFTRPCEKENEDTHRVYFLNLKNLKFLISIYERYLIDAVDLPNEFGVVSSTAEAILDLNFLILKILVNPDSGWSPNSRVNPRWIPSSTHTLRLPWWGQNIFSPKTSFCSVYY